LTVIGVTTFLLTITLTKQLEAVNVNSPILADHKPAQGCALVFTVYLKQLAELFIPVVVGLAKTAANEAALSPFSKMVQLQS